MRVENRRVQLQWKYFSSTITASGAHSPWHRGTILTEKMIGSWGQLVDVDLLLLPDMSTQEICQFWINAVGRYPTSGWGCERQIGREKGGRGGELSVH